MPVPSATVSWALLASRSATASLYEMVDTPPSVFSSWLCREPEPREGGRGAGGRDGEARHHQAATFGLLAFGGVDLMDSGSAVVVGASATGSVFFGTSLTFGSG